MKNSLVLHARPYDGLIEKGLKEVVCLLTPYTLIKYCCVLEESLVLHARPDDGRIEKGPKHVVCLLTPYTLIKFCRVLTYPLYIFVILPVW